MTLRFDCRYIRVLRSAAPALLPIFRSRLQADILAALLLDAEEEHSLTDIARQFDAPLSTVHGQVKRLTEAGLLRRRSVGRSALVRANAQNRLIEPLTQMLLLSWGPMQVVADEFAALPKAQRVMIFGSWAARYLGRTGPAPHDLDVLVVGKPTRESVYDAADRVEQRQRMPVNPVIRSAETWDNAEDPLARRFRSSPFVPVLEPDDAAAEKAAADEQMAARRGRG